jgi:tetratricopeptide (TPR) repeat protein
VNAPSERDTGPSGNLPALVPSPPREIATRRHLPRTRLGEVYGVLDLTPRVDAGEGRPSLATRRHQQFRKRRLKRVLIGIAIVLAIFPPMWAVYLIAWIVWRTRPAQRSMRLVRQSVRALEKNRTGVALQKLQEAHYLDTGNNDALYWLGLLLSRQNRHEEAAEALSLVAERIPGLPEVEAALTDAYVAIDRPESAVYHAQRLMDAAPYAPESQLRLATAFEATGRTDLAIQALEEAPLNRRNMTAPRLQVQYQLGVLYEREGDAERALEHFKRVYAHDVTFQDVRKRLEAVEARLKK